MQALTKREKRAKDFIRETIKTTGIAPSMPEIAVGIGCLPQSKSSAHEALKGLEYKGHIRRRTDTTGRCRPRNIELIEDGFIVCPHCGHRSEART